MLKKIVVTQDLGMSLGQKERLTNLGDVTFYDELAKNPDEWEERVKEADIICSGKLGLKVKVNELKNKYISLPFVGVSFIDKEKTKANNTLVSNCPGCNKVPVSEWVIAMMLNLFRRFHDYVNVDNLPQGERMKPGISLKGKKITILGKGNVGSRVGKIAEAMGMIVNYFERGDNIYEEIKDAKVVVDTLSSNPSTHGLLDDDFFKKLKKDTFFITVTGRKIYDTDAIIKYLDNRHLGGAAMDAGSIQVGDTSDEYYQKLLKHPKVIATPHIAWCSDEEEKVSNDMMIDNIEAWLKSEPINLVK